MGTFSIWHWLVVLLVVVLVFGSGKLADIGKNVGKAIRGYQQSMREGAAPAGEGESAPDAAALESRQSADGAASTSSSENAAKTASS